MYQVLVVGVSSRTRNSPNVAVSYQQEVTFSAEEVHAPVSAQPRPQRPGRTLTVISILLTTIAAVITAIN